MMSNINEKKSKQKIKYSFSKILTGSDLSSRRLAQMQAISDQPGPVIWLTACVHGDEIGGIAIIQEIFKRLKKFPLLKGSIYAFPLMNPIGFETATRHISISEEDLNRSFPGDKEGSVAERLANQVFTGILKTKPSLVLDLHNDWTQSIPYTLIDPYPGLKHKNAYALAKSFSQKLGFVVIDEREDLSDAPELKRTLSGSLLFHDIPALTLELGGAYVVEEINVQAGVIAIWNLLVSLGMVKEIQNKSYFKTPKFLKSRILKYEHLSASSSGIVRFLAKPGEIIKKGQPVARVYNVFGKLQETLKAQHQVIVLGHADYSIAFPGLDIMAFGIIK